MLLGALVVLVSLNASLPAEAAAPIHKELGPRRESADRAYSIRCPAKWQLFDEAYLATNSTPQSGLKDLFLLLTEDRALSLRVAVVGISAPTAVTPEKYMEMMCGNKTLKTIGLGNYSTFSYCQKSYTVVGRTVPGGTHHDLRHDIHGIVKKRNASFYVTIGSRQPLSEALWATIRAMLSSLRKNS